MFAILARCVNVIVLPLLFCCYAAGIGAAMTVPTATVLQQRLAAGETSSQALVEQSLAAVTKQLALNAFISVDKAGARQRAKQLDALRQQGHLLGPLHGIPIAVKDNIHVAGLPNSAGTAMLKHFTPGQDATVIQRLKAAGAIILGKNNMHELAYGITSDNGFFGAVGNAHNADYIAGGSSGGTAVAVAAGMVSLGLGTDTGGSSRIPAALNGIVGFRPTVGRYPAQGLTRISHTRDTAGPIAHSVADVALLDSVLSGEPLSTHNVALSGLRLGVPRRYFYHNLEPAVAEHTERLLRALTRAGVELVEEDIEGLAALNDRVGLPIVLFESSQLLASYIDKHLPGQTVQSLLAAVASPDVSALLGDAIDGVITESVYRVVMENHRPQLQQLYRDYFKQHRLDAIIFPTTPLTARPIAGSLETVTLNGEQVPTFPTYIRNTDPSSNAGIPGLTLPVGKTADGMPIGIEIDGPEATDQRLLAIGAAIERLIQASAL